MGPVTTRNVDFQGDTFAVESDEFATSVWDAELCLFAVAGTGWKDEQIGELIKVFRLGRATGERDGRINLQTELRRLLDAPSTYDVDAASQH